jgi:hypothetical protein
VGLPGPVFDEMSTHMVKSVLNGFFGNTRLVDPCLEDLVIGCGTIYFDSRFDCDMKTRYLTGEKCSYFLESGSSINNP